MPSYLFTVPKDHPETVRPWGGYTVLKKTKTMWIKKLYLRKNQRLSLQSHALRNEVWFVLSGIAIIQIGKKQTRAQPGDTFFVPKNTKHRISGITRACILEVAFGKVVEKDIVRYEDDYGR